MTDIQLPPTELAARRAARAGIPISSRGAIEIPPIGYLMHHLDDRDGCLLLWAVMEGPIGVADLPPNRGNDIGISAADREIVAKALERSRSPWDVHRAGCAGCDWCLAVEGHR